MERTVEQNREFAQKIVAELGPEWSFTEENSFRTLYYSVSITWSKCKGAAIYFRVNKDKYEVSALGIRDSEGQYVTVHNCPLPDECKCSINKDIRLIANDIRKKILPQYALYIEKALDIIAKRDSYAQRIQTLRQKIESVMGKPFPKKGEELYVGKGIYSIRVGGEDVEIVLNVKSANIVKALEILKSEDVFKSSRQK